MNTIANNKIVTDIGNRARDAWNDAGKYGDGGDALATHALYVAARTMSFAADVNRGSKNEPVIDVVTFDLSDVASDPRNNDGSIDNKLKSARTAAIALAVFGVEERDNAFNQRLSRCIKMALYLFERHADLDDDAYLAAVATRQVKVSRATGSNMTVCLVVPEAAIFAPPMEDADDEVKTRYAANANLPRTLNGKDRASLAELGRRANPPKATRATGENKSNGASFASSVAFVRAIVQQNSNPEADEADVALSNELRRELFSLSQDIAAYFAADPLEEEEIAPQTAAA